MIEGIKWQGQMCLKSTREAIHFEVYSVKILNKKNMSSRFLLDEQAKKKRGSGKLKTAGLGNVLSTLFYFSLLNYGSPWHHHLVCLHRTKKKKTLCNRQKNGCSHGSFERTVATEQAETNAFDDAY